MKFLFLKLLCNFIVDYHILATVSLLLSIQHLLRQGQEAVQVVHELDILSTEYLDDSPAVGGELVG